MMGTPVVVISIVAENAIAVLGKERFLSVDICTHTINEIKTNLIVCARRCFLTYFLTKQSPRCIKVIAQFERIQLNRK